MSNYLTSSEVATELRVTTSAISRWVSSGQIPAEFIRRPSGKRKGSKILIAREALDYLLKPTQTPEHKKQQCHNSTAYERLMSHF